VGIKEHRIKVGMKEHRIKVGIKEHRIKVGMKEHRIKVGKLVDAMVGIEGHSKVEAGKLVRVGVVGTSVH
jgi:hypothetical protein